MSNVTYGNGTRSRTHSATRKDVSVVWFGCKTGVAVSHVPPPGPLPPALRKLAASSCEKSPVEVGRPGEWTTSAAAAAAAECAAFTAGGGFLASAIRRIDYSES